ncbi:MAG TPA: amidohydrolase family protein [Fimbriimonadaceae bacterium]|nr:amidohydrolase family protein [Fimbriimonadaceae bacterium]
MAELSRREVLVAGAALGISGLSHASEDYDLVVQGGTVVDPETRFRAIRYVGIRGGKIAAVSKNKLKGRRVIDAAGLVVAPGFIDPIAHGQNLENDRLQALDGVTTKLQMENGAEDQDLWHKDQQGKRILNFGAGYSHTKARGTIFKDDSERAVATDSQVRDMAIMLDGQLRKGALGVGFGLEYQPGSTRWEVIEMFRIAGLHKARCHVHTRYGTLLEEESNLTALQEVIANGLVHGTPVHICHVPSMALGNTERALAFIERAQARGLDVTADFYPYTAFGTGIASEVFAPGWQKKFGIDYKDLQYAKTNERLTAETFEKYRAEGGMVIAHAIPEAAVRAAVKSSCALVGSDGSLREGVGHPRSAGTFCRVLGHYALREGLISMETALAKMTYRTAKVFEARCPEFKRKGRLRVGMDADIVAFDPRTVIDSSTFDKPGAPSKGIEWLLVNGQVVVEKGQVLEVMAGKPLRA